MKQEHWRDLCGRMRCHSAAERFTELEQAHSEKHRRYHTAQHIAECLALFDTLRDLCEFPDEVEFAIRNLSTTMGHSSGLIREQSPVWWGSGWAG